MSFCSDALYEAGLSWSKGDYSTEPVAEFGSQHRGRCSACPISASNPGQFNCYTNSNIAASSTPNTPEFSATQILAITMFTAIELAIIYKKKVSKNDELRVYALMSIDFPFEQ